MLTLFELFVHIFSSITDANISICFDGTQDKNRKSCCTRKTELKYSESAEKYLRDSVRSSNAFLKKFIMDSLAEYQGEWVCKQVCA